MSYGDERWPSVEPGPITDEGERIAWERQENRKAARVPRDLTCPTCKTPNALTPAMAARGHQCNRCADLEEGCY